MRKATWRLIPLIALGYGAAYMDRANISFASLQMNVDLHFSSTVYGFGAGLFFVSYAVCELPSNLLLVRFGARRWLARIMVTWGLLAMAMMFVRTPLQFYVARFLLGAAEAGFFPGVVYYLMQWFPPHMRARTISRFYISLPLSQAVMGALAGELLGLQGRAGLAGWQWLFLIEGLPPLVLSVAIFFLLPDGPAEAPWLTPPERTWIVDQIARDAASGGHSHDIGRALRDPRVWLIGLVFFCMLGQGYAFSFSAPAILVKLTGFSIANVGYLISGISLLGALAMIVNALSSDRIGERYVHAAVPLMIIAIGYCVGGLSAAPRIAVPALAMVLIAHGALQGPLLSIPSEFLKGKSCAAGIAAMNTIGMLGGFVGPYWMGIAKDLTGDYQHGLLTLTIPSVVAVTIILALRLQARRATVGAVVHA